MSKRGKRVLKVVLVAYVAGLGLFIYDAAKNRETAVLPGLIEETITVPEDSGDDAVLVAKRYRARVNRKFVKQGDLVTAEVIEALRAAGEKEFHVWDPRYALEFLAARPKVSAATDLKAGGTMIVGAGDVITEDTLLRLISAREELVDDADKKAIVDGRMLIRGRGAAIGINLTMAFTWLNFLALAAALYAFLWEPVLKLLDERAEAIRSDIESAQTRREEAEDLRESLQKEFDDLRSRHDHILQEARVEAHREREQIILEAKGKAKLKLEEAEQEIETMTAEARGRLAAEIGEMATEISARILEREIGADEHRKLIDDFVSGIEKGPGAPGGDA